MTALGVGMGLGEGGKVPREELTYLKIRRQEGPKAAADRARAPCCPLGLGLGCFAQECSKYEEYDKIC